MLALGLLAWTFRDLDVARASLVIARAGGCNLLWALLPMGCALGSWDLRATGAAALASAQPG